MLSDTKKSNIEFQPRCIRLNKAPLYLGMGKELFEKNVRPHLVEIPIGENGIGFDRLDLDEFFDNHKHRNGRPGRKGNDV